MIREPLPVARPVPPTPRRTVRRRWRDKFREATRGVKLGVRGQSSFAAHFFCATVAIAAGIALQCRLWEWCLILLCIGLVLTAELFNSAIEALFHGLDPETKSRWNGCLDIAAGAVLTASLFAGLVGLLVFGNRFGEVMRWWT
jgi:diacylglycerol kinase